MNTLDFTYDKSKIAVAKHPEKRGFFHVNLISHPQNKYEVSEGDLKEFLSQLEDFLKQREENKSL